MPELNEITLYTGPDCHLCDLAKDIIYPLLSEHQFKLQQVDISDDPRLKQQYGTRIPVIKFSNGDEKNWPFTAGQVRKKITAIS